MKITPSLVRRYAAATWTPPFRHELPSSAEAYVESVSDFKIAWRRLKRDVNFLLHGQRKLQVDRIDVKAHRKILWIHHGTPQVGDSLTDLAARELLRGAVDRVDLLTDKHLVPLYQSDEIFQQAASNPDELPRDYDLVLLHSASSRSVRDKFKHFREVQFAHVYGVYTGPELNRTLFGYFRLAELLGLSLSTQAIDKMACPSMHCSPQEAANIAGLNLPPGALALCIGGVRDWCTYMQWPEFIGALRARGVSCPIVLLGSSNGLDMRDQILRVNGPEGIIDRVSQHSLGEVHEIMRRSALVVCADGGLLHVAHTARVPVVTLFAGISEPRFRLTAANRTRWLYGAKWVNDVSHADLAALVAQSLSSR